MIGLIFSAIIVFFGLSTTLLLSLNLSQETFVELCIVAGSTVFFITALIAAISLIPLQKAQQHTTPYLLDFYNRDFHQRFYILGLLFFVLFSFAIAAAISLVLPFYQIFLFSVWFLALGASTDLLRHFYRRTINFLNPFFCLSLITQQAKTSITDNQSGEAAQWVTALSDIAVSGIEKSHTTLTSQAINEIQQVAHHFLKRVTSISHPAPESSEIGQGDEIRYVLFGLFQKLELINTKAVQQHLEIVSESLVSALGKIALYAAQCDVSLVTFPLEFLGRCALQALQGGSKNVAIKAIYVFQEVAKTILTDIDIAYAELRTPFYALISQMEQLSKALFKQDKTTNVLLLMQPFLELRKLFSEGKMATHLDTPAILSDLNRVLGEFEALQSVLQMAPPPNA